jgi:hypothetical protein
MTNLLYIFDNFTFNNNTFIVNTIKRWFCYEINNLINSGDISNIKKITLIKTGPTVQICDLKIDNLVVEKILSIIDGLIYKRYAVYPNAVMKEIIEYFGKNVSPDNKIIVFSSINNLGIAPNNLNILNDILKDLPNKITYYNIGKYAFISILLTNIEEIFIDYRTNKLENIISKEHNIFKINAFDSNILNSKHINPDNLILKKQKLLDSELLIQSINKESINGESINGESINDKIIIQSEFLSNYLTKLQNIEYYIMENNTMDTDIYNKILGIFSLELLNEYVIDRKIFNMLKCFINLIKMIIEKKYNKCPIIVPIDEMDEKYKETNIEYILDFYKQIYPKIVNYHLDLGVKGFKIPTNLKTTSLNYKLLEGHVQIDKNNIKDQSVEFLTSNLSMTDWVDEYNDYNPFGFLIKYEISKFSFKGLIDENSTIIKWYPNLVVNSISNNCISVNDYYQMVISDLDNIEENFIQNDGDDGNNINEYKIVSQKEKLSLRNFTIIDKMNGDSNIILPIFINKKHWELVKMFWNYHMSIINNTFEYNYNKKMDNIYYLVLLKNFGIFTDNNKLTNNMIRTFCYYLRTSIQLMIDNKYVNSAQNEVIRLHNQLVNIPNSYDINKEQDNPNTDNLRNNSINYIVRIIQWIVSSNSDINKLKKYLVEYRNVVIKNYIEKFYKLDFWENIKTKTQEEQLKEIDILKQECVQENKSLFELEIDLICLCEFINKIYKLKGFNQFIKFIDSYNGCLPVNSDSLLNCDIFKTIYNTLENDKNFNIENFIKQVDFSDYLV